MIVGHNFTDQLMTARALAEFIDIFTFHRNGRLRGMVASKNAKTITVSSGMCIINGRMIEIRNNETINVTNGDGEYKLILEIDLRERNTNSKVNQIKFKVVNKTHTLVKENLFDFTGNIYQEELAAFTISGNQITTINTTLQNFGPNGLVERFDREINNIKLQQSVVTQQDLNRYVLKTELNNIVPKTGITPPDPNALSDGQIYIQYLN